MISVKVSIGVTTILKKMSAENGIKQADLALYQAKRFGKNQVRVYGGKESSNSGYPESGKVYKFENTRKLE